MRPLGRELLLNRRVQTARLAGVPRSPLACWPGAHDEHIVAAIIEAADGLARARRPLKRLRKRIPLGETDERVPVKKGGGAHPHFGKLEMPLFECFRQPNIDEIALELTPSNLALLDQSRKDVLFKRTRQVANEIEDVALQHVDSAIDDPWPGPARILFQERHDLSPLFDHAPIASRVGD